MFRRLVFPLALTLVGLGLTYRPALAHDGEPHGAAGWWAAWTFEPAVILLLAVTLLLYARGWRALARRPGGASIQLKGRTWAFAGGMAALMIALISPIDGLAGELFWVHMLQHNLLMLVAAPLLALSYPLAPMLLGLPEGARRRLGQGWRRMSLLRGLWGLVSSPPAVWLLQAFLLWIWHAPVLYGAAVDNEWVHAAQHFSFLGSALLFWWVTLHTFGARSAYRGAGILYLFTTALHSGLLGALLTFSPRIWYQVYIGRAETWGITALVDQQLAGTIMWVPSGMVYLAAALWLMKTWLDSIESREETVFREEH